MSTYGFASLSDFEITPERILSKVSDTVLWRYYLGCDFEVGVSISARYRVDRTPSFFIYYNSTKHKIYAKDYGKGGFEGDIFAYVQKVHGLNFYSALVKINLDFNLGFLYSPAKYQGGTVNIVSSDELKRLKSFERKHDRKYTKVQFKSRQYSERDYEYWASYGISGATLRMYKVYAVQQLYLGGDSTYIYNPGRPCYAYYFPKTYYREEEHAKCYFPCSPPGSLRFMGNASNLRDVQGYDQCAIARQPRERGELLVLTKSMKDCMLFREFGIDAMASHGETQRFLDDFIRHIKGNYDRIISLYDRDASGIIGAKYLWKDYGIVPHFINKKYACKDISDLYKMHGKDTVKGFIEQIANKQTSICAK